KTENNFMQAIFKGKTYGSVTIGERGQIVIPAGLRKALNIKSGDQLIVFAKPDKKVINLMPEKDFSRFLERAAKLISKLENKLQKKR
ncbi:MAG: AbrB/MazE/SpoVT family DNA-binding domain-containing protein, partial [Candidatus Omnitrophota bacterium]|nr:AbrB/MazE/SpoVT family DNA-binding domain-containing protein [Candidatus Omnitrophota bacterium]